MKVCDLNSGMGQLTQSFSQLKDRLNEIKTHWNDDTLRQFEETYLAPIPGRMQLMVAGVQRLADAVMEAERECDDRPEQA